MGGGGGGWSRPQTGTCGALSGGDCGRIAVLNWPCHLNVVRLDTGITRVFTGVGTGRRFG